MTVALKPARQHGYRLTAYERKENDFYPTPSDLVVSLALGLPQLGLELPRVALDPCGGDGALRRCLAPFGVDVRLSDLYPEMYLTTDGYLTSPRSMLRNLNTCSMPCGRTHHASSVMPDPLTRFEAREDESPDSGLSGRANAALGDCLRRSAM